MAKIKTSIVMPPGITINQLPTVPPQSNGPIMLSKLPSGGYRMQKHPNNTRTTSPNFIGMNNTVVSLDAQYKGLTNKPDWEAAAITYAGVQVCGCDGKTIDGQKLFRLMNYLHTIIGVPITATPKDSGGGIALKLTSLTLAFPPVVDEPEVQYQGDGGTDGWWMILQQGLGLMNPILEFAPGSFSFIVAAPDPLFYYAQYYLTKPTVQWCTWDFSERPTGTGSCPVIVI